MPGYFPTYAFAGPLLSLYVSTHISSTSFSLDFPIPGRKLCSLNMNINYRMRMRLVQVLSSDLSSARCVLGEWQSRLKSCSRGACSRASGQVWVQATTSKGGRSHKGAYRLEMGTPRKNARMQECKNARDARMQECKNARMQEMPHSTSTWQAGGQPITQRASCCLHRTSEHHRTAAYPRFPVPKIAALPRVHPPKLPMYSQSRAAA